MLSVFVGVKIYDATRPDPKPDRSAARIVFPASFGSFTVATDRAAQELISQARTADGKNARIVAAKFAVYRRADKRLILVRAVSAHDSAAVNKVFRETKPGDRLDEQLTAEHVIGGIDYPAAPFGGGFRCGTGVGEQGVSISICAWSDTDTAAEIVDVPSATSGKPISPRELSGITKQLRVSAETS